MISALWPLIVLAGVMAGGMLELHWQLGIGLLLVAVLIRGRGIEKEAKSPQEEHRSWLIKVGLTLMIGLSLWRILTVSDLPLWWDEAITDEVVRNLREEGTPYTLQYHLGYYRGILYHVLLAWVTEWLGAGPDVMRLPGQAASVAIGWLVVVFFWKGERELGVVSGTLILLSPYSLEMGDYARFYALHGLGFAVACVMYWYGYVQPQKGAHWWRGAFLVGVAGCVHLSQMSMLLLLLWPTLVLIRAPRWQGSLMRWAWGSVLEAVKVIRKWWLHIACMVILIALQKQWQADADVATWYLLHSDPYYYHYEHQWSHLMSPSIALWKHYGASILPLTLLILGTYMGLTGKAGEKVRYITLMVTLMSLAYAVGHRGVEGARIFWLWEAFYWVMVMAGMLHLLEGWKEWKRRLTLITCMLIILIYPPLNIWEIRHQDIGDDITHNPFRSTHVSLIRNDDSKIYEVLQSVIEPDDLWVSTVATGSGRVNRSPDAILNQNVRWESVAVLETQYGTKRNIAGSELLGGAEDFMRYLQAHPQQTIYLTVRGGSRRVQQTIHLREDMEKLLEQQKAREIYRSPDGEGVIYRYPGI